MPLPPDTRTRVLTNLSRPIVAFCVRHGVTYQALTTILKPLFLHCAAQEIMKTSPKVNSSRISAITGLHRDEINRLQSEAPSSEEDEPHNLIGRVVLQWRHDRRFASPSGVPRALKIKGKDSEFTRLVESVSGHLNSGTVLFELDRLGYIQRTKQRVKLLRQSESLQADPVKGFELVAKDMETLLMAGEQNILALEDSSNLHLRTEFDNIITKNLPEIRRWLVERGKEFHRQVRAYLACHDKDLAAGECDDPGGGSVVFGAFSLTAAPSLDTEKTSEKS